MHALHSSAANAVAARESMSVSGCWVGSIGINDHMVCDCLMWSLHATSEAYAKG